MAIWHAVTTWVPLALFALGAAGAVVSASTGCAAKALDGLSIKWLWPILLVFAGDAALGPNRPMWERGLKGVAVALLLVSLSIGWLRVRRSRRRPQPDPAS